MRAAPADEYRATSHLAAEHFAASLAANTHRWHKLLKDILSDDSTDLTSFQTKDFESR